MHDWHIPTGYRFAGIHCGLRADEPGRRDLALMVSDRPAAAAAVFTQNRVAAAPVRVSRERVPQAQCRGVVVCSGNANACTGAQGIADAERMATLAATQIGCLPDQMLVASTGVIGRMLPMAVFENGIPAAAAVLASSRAAANDAAHAIMTTDTVSKTSSRSIPQLGVSVLGFAKGAAMIGPNMATMLGFLFTDAAVAPDALQAMLRRAVNRSFNCISVEGHMSTNDTVFLFANGQGAALSGPHLADLERHIAAVCVDLAKAIALDAEGSTHFVTIEVEGVRDDDEAHRIAKTVAESALVKTAFYGADPNWGRFVSAAGYAGVPFEENQLSLWLDDIELYRNGGPLPVDLPTMSAHIRQHRNLTLRYRFTLGSGRCTFWTCDLTPEYVRLNSEYTT
jgi:glutamate N-acetyltransferase/amino-acid N-acetyltransferase